MVNKYILRLSTTNGTVLVASPSAIGRQPDASGSSVPAWPARLAENKRLITATAWVEVMPTGLSSTTQPWTSRLFFLAARAAGSLLVGASESGAICTSDAAATYGDFCIT